ncbi:MAG: hypothetical protein E6R13_10225 [Spirochaetes bacterium]|nr:MAG: hypothetical protein E6R13_10225 [Spirochaetota bacterium]
MKEQIIELRIKIDGLSQLTKGLTPKTQAIDFLACPRLEEELLDTWIERAKSVGAYKESVFSNSKEVQKAYDSLILAKAWLGKILGEIGESTPYANDGNRKDVKDIEPAADKMNPVTNRVSVSEEPVVHPYNHFVTFSRTQWQDKSHVEKVDWLREELNKVFLEFKTIPLTGLQFTTVMSFEQHIQEARFHLGFELGRIRDEQTEFNV